MLNELELLINKVYEKDEDAYNKMLDLVSNNKLKISEKKEAVNHLYYYTCPTCGNDLIKPYLFCRFCGQELKD